MTNYTASASHSSLTIVFSALVDSTLSRVQAKPFVNWRPGAGMSRGFERQWPSLELRAGALVFRPSQDGGFEILLIRRHGHVHWSIPKGKPIADKDLHEAAAIEAFEEAGVTGKVSRNALGSYLHDKTPKLFGDRPKIVEVVTFALEVMSVEMNWPELDTRARQWVSPKDAAHLVRPGQLRDMILAFVPKRVPEEQSD